MQATKKQEPEPGNAIQRQAGDPRAVAKQQIMAETVRNETRHLQKNRTNDFSINPASGKYITNLTPLFYPLSENKWHGYEQVGWKLN